MGLDRSFYGQDLIRLAGDALSDPTYTFQASVRGPGEQPTGAVDALVEIQGISTLEIGAAFGVLVRGAA